MKTVFISHPLSNDVMGNVEKVLRICEEVHRQGVIPVAPYLASVQYLNDDVVEDRELGIEANKEALRRKYVDELWLFGEFVSKGMIEEIALANELGIPVVAKSIEIAKRILPVAPFSFAIAQDKETIKEIKDWINNLKKVFVIFDKYPSGDSQACFIEVEDEEGRGVRVEWEEYKKGLVRLGPFYVREEENKNEK